MPRCGPGRAASFPDSLHRRQASQDCVCRHSLVGLDGGRTAPAFAVTFPLVPRPGHMTSSSQETEKELQSGVHRHANLAHVVSDRCRVRSCVMTCRCDPYRCSVIHFRKECRIHQNALDGSKTRKSIAITGISMPSAARSKRVRNFTPGSRS